MASNRDPRFFRESSSGQQKHARSIRQPRPIAPSYQPEVSTPKITVESVNEKLSEIILTLHKNKEFVSLQVVENNLSQIFGVTKLRDLHLDLKLLTPWNNLKSRMSSINQYISIFKQTFNICTLYDFRLLIAQFLETDDYDNLHLGPLETHPDVIQLFNYKPAKKDDPVPHVTTGDVLRVFIEYSDKFKEARETIFNSFVAHLVEKYELKSINGLGLFCRSFAYVLQVSGRVRRDLRNCQNRASKAALDELTIETENNLRKIKSEILTEQQQSSFTRKMSPVDLFNHLLSIVEKHFYIFPYQSLTYGALSLLKDNKLLRCLVNLSIFLGTIEQPEELKDQLKRFYIDMGPNQSLQQFEFLMETHTEFANKRKLEKIKKNRRDIKLLMHEWEQSNEPLTNDNTTADMNTFSIQRPLLRVPFETLCAEAFQYARHYRTLLTIDQLFEIEQSICKKYETTDFSNLSYNENDSTESRSFLSFLLTFRDQIDPKNELSIYDKASVLYDQETVRGFVQQLNIFNKASTETIQEHALTEVQEQAKIERLTLIDKAIKHRFGESMGSRQTKLLFEDVLVSDYCQQQCIIRYEESLVDKESLSRLDVCPPSLNVEENTLFKIISTAPVLLDLPSWLSWNNLFKPKYGEFRTFIQNNQNAFENLLLLETSDFQLVRIPQQANQTSFQENLKKNRVREAVADLCSIVVQEGSIIHFSFNVFQVFIETWLHQLRSQAILRNDFSIPFSYAVEFLVYLPPLIGQKRLVKEIFLESFEQMFQVECAPGSNLRTNIWNYANLEQRRKLEYWGYLLEIEEWKNSRKWSGVNDEEYDGVSRVEDHTSHPSHPILDFPPDRATVEQKLEQPVTTIPTVETISEINTSAFAHIESIRKNLGADNTLNSAGQSIVNNLHNILQNSLEKLSTDVYSEEGHFVLELIQNADDNHYEVLTPTIRFFVSRQRILVCNNEVGFSKENISAICSVGASTKGKHKKGYTGHKGIGFKSVFMVSHQPEIHSREYHIRFDTNDGKEKIGYILPIWLKTFEEPGPESSQWQTFIRLPIRKDAGIESLMQKFANVEAKLLLFLNRLRKIEIVDEHKSPLQKKVFSRTDYADGAIIELTEQIDDTTCVRNLWLVVKKVVEVPDNIQNKLRDIKGPVSETTIAIAFPLRGIAEAKPPVPPSQPIFAYLPLRSCGFRFILQADFEIPASRQDLRRDNLWNEWLKSQMPLLMYSAYQQFKELPDLIADLNLTNEHYEQPTDIQVIKFFLKFLPANCEIDLYFQLFVNRSFEVLSGTLQLPVVNMRLNGEKEVIWVPPAQCVIAKDPFTRTMITEALLLTHRNSYYLHDEIVNECDQSLLVALGCRILNSTDILQLIESSYNSIDQEYPKTDMTIMQAAQWLICVGYYFQKKDENDVLKRLKQIKIFPVDSHKNLISIDEFHNRTILLPFGKERKFAKNLKIVIDEVPALDSKFIQFVEEHHPTRLKQFIDLLKKLGFQETPNIRNLYSEYFIPTMSDPTLWATKSSSLLIAYFMCIFQYMYANEGGTSEVIMDQLRKKLLVKTKENKFLPLGSPNNFFHLTTTYGAKCSLENLLAKTDRCHFISDDYYRDYCDDEIFKKPQLRRKFSEFLEELKIIDFFRIEMEDKQFTDVEQVMETKWASSKAAIEQRLNEPFVIRDYVCQEIEELLSSNLDYKFSIEILQYLHNNYAQVHNYLTASVMKLRLFKHRDMRSEKGICSSFMLSLLDAVWIPVGEGKLMRPGDAYLLNQSQQAFCRYVPHIDSSVAIRLADSPLIELLGIRKEITQKDLFKLLMKWSCELDEESLNALIQSNHPSEIIPCALDGSFKRSTGEPFETICQIYHFLSQNKETLELLYRFRLWPIVYLPVADNKGDFVFVRDVYWEEVSLDIPILGPTKNIKVRNSIGKYYQQFSSLENLFVNHLGVEVQSSIDDYIPLLSSIESVDEPWALISIIIQLAIREKKQGELLVKCSNIAFIPCSSITKPFAKYTDEKLLFPNDSDLAKLFSDVTTLVKLPMSTSTMNIEQFCSIFNIKNLTDVLRVEVQTKNGERSPMISDFYEKSIDLIQHHLLSNQLIDDDTSKQFAEVLKKIKFLSVDSIRLIHCYEDVIRELPGTLSTRDAYMDKDAAQFYIVKAFENSEIRFIGTMAEFLVGHEPSKSVLIHFIEELVYSYQRDPKQGLNKYRAQLANSYEPKWVICTETVEELPIAKEPIPKETVQITKEEIMAVANEKPIGREETSDQSNPKISDTKRLLQMPSEEIANPSNNEALQHYKSISAHTPSQTARDITSFSINRDSNSNTIQNIPQEGTNSRRSLSETTIESENIPHSEITIPRPPPRTDLLAKTEDIVIKNLDELDFSAFASIDSDIIRIPKFDKEGHAGHVGEKIVFEVLKRTYPDAKITWENEKQESFKPYDIYIERTNGENEFIEVKTTKNQNEKSFFVSVPEVKFFVDHPEHSSIYRVYHADPIESSTITRISRVKDNLNAENLRLVMTIFSKSN